MQTCAKSLIKSIVDNSKLPESEISRCLYMHLSELRDRAAGSQLSDDDLSRLRGLLAATEVFIDAGFTLDRRTLRQKIGCVSIFDVVTSNGKTEEAAQRLVRSLERDLVDRVASTERMKSKGCSWSGIKQSDPGVEIGISTATAQ